MFRTVFARLVTVFLGVMLVAMSVQGVMLYNVYKNDAIVRMQQDMMAEAHGVALLMGRFFSTYQGQGEMYNYIHVSAQTRQSEIWFVNAEGNITLLARPDSANPEEMATLIPLNDREIERYLKPVLAGHEFSMLGNFQGHFKEDTVTVACPVYWRRNEIVGAAFLHSTVDELNIAYSNAWKIIVLSGVFTGTLVMLLVSITAQSITRPIAAVNRAAKQIAQGNFDSRLEKTGPDEIGQLSESFNRMAEELKKQEQMRVSFVANVSHELKSPMTSIQGFAQGMVDGTIAPQEHPRYLNIILDETKRLTKMVRELLDLSQVENGKFPLNITSFDLNELIRRVIIRYIDRMEEKGIEPEVEFRQEYSYVQADSERIEQVLVNLVDNAIKFTPEGGSIRIMTHTAQDKVLISIADSGFGIPQEDLPFIFDRFYKADKSHTDKKGTGLGLAIVRSILEQHGESIQAASREGSGTTFSFALKAAEKPQKEENKKLSSKNEQEM